MPLRPNARTWPMWLAAAATAWFVAIVIVWATHPLVDRVPTTVRHVVVAGDKSKPDDRDNGGVVKVRCADPISSSAIGDGGLPALKVAQDQRFSRRPCSSFHRQSHWLFIANTVLYATTLGVAAAVLSHRRRRSPLQRAFA